jgi:acetolactate decarboxylase
MMFRLFTLLFLSLVACTPETHVQKQELFQVSTIDALMQGVYDGNTSLKELSENGDFGIGTFNTLDGELILENGTFYQVKSDGKVYRPSDEIKTPFASVVHFAPEDSIAINNLDFLKLKQVIDSLMGSQNYFYAIRLEGNFETVHTRSVPAQVKPYRPLIEVTQKQP